MTTLTKEHHRKAYPAISPSSPLNSHSGHTILITGSSSGIGLEAAKAFVTASASLIIILGRRQEPLSAAVEELKASLHANSGTKVLARKCDIGNGEEMYELWAGLKREGIEVDVMVLNAAKTGPMTVNSEWKKVWEFYEVNVLANLRMTEKFLAQGPERGKALVNISSASAHMNPSYDHSVYAASKGSFAHLAQLLADEIPVEKCQIISVHPGRIFTEGAKAAGYTENSIPWDSIELPAAYCVWASTSQAAFLHGRFVWTDWGVDELLAIKGKFEDPGFLKFGLQGVDPVSPAAFFAMT